MTLTAVLLAGGESRRMGVDKATLVFGGEPLWQRQLGTLRQLDPLAIFVSTRRPVPWQPQDTELVLDQPPSGGPASGIAAALMQMRTSHLVALAVDMPFITAKDLLEFCTLAAPGCGAVPLASGRAEPLAAVYPKEAVGEFETALAEGRLSLQPLIQQLAVVKKMQLVPVQPSAAGIYQSVNHLADLE